MFLAPAFTSGAISLEREKQTLDMLAATPISSLAIVVGKLFSALAYVFLLIAASIPLTAIVFVFGGVGPDDVLRAYAVLIVSAIGLGALGLFISAVMQRTQGATVVTFFAVLFLSLGTMFGVLFWNTMAGVNRGGLVAAQGVGPIRGTAPEALLWFNPFAAEYDVICGASDGYGGWCSRLNTVTNGAISVTGYSGGGVLPTPSPASGSTTAVAGSSHRSRPSRLLRSRSCRTARSSRSTTPARWCRSRPRTHSRSASGGTRSGRAACGRGRSSPSSCRGVDPARLPDPPLAVVAPSGARSR